MSTSYYRIQSADRDVQDLLDPELQISISYVDDTERAGVSVCDSLEDLAQYLAASGLPFDTDYVVVEVEGTCSADEDEDAHLGARLVHPTAIVAVEPITARLLDLIDDSYEMAA